VRNILSVAVKLESTFHFQTANLCGKETGPILKRRESQITFGKLTWNLHKKYHFCEKKSFIHVYGSLITTGERPNGPEFLKCF